MANPWLCALLLVPLLGGCGAHGKNWVDGDARRPSRAPVAPRSVAWEEEAAPPPRPRLHHVVTLGQSELPEPEAVPAPAAPPAPPVVVNVHNTFAPRYGYGAFVPVVPVGTCLHCGHRVQPSRASVPRTGTHIGRDWPGPRDSGPVFPFNAAPADPWAGRR